MFAPRDVKALVQGYQLLGGPQKQKIGNFVNEKHTIVDEAIV